MDVLNAAVDAICRLSPQVRDDLPFVPMVPTKPNGTAKSWFQERNGRFVWTIQFEVDAEGNVGRLWTPGQRVIDASRATYVLMDGSRRDYAGLRVDGRSDDVLLASCEWGGRRQVMLYLLDTRATHVID